MSHPIQLMRTQPFPIQLLDLTLLQLTNVRWAWRGTLLLGVLAPLIFMGLAAGLAQSNTATLGYVLTGNVVLSLLFSTLGNVSNNFSYMRESGTLDYLATLPVQRVALIIATAIAFLLLSLPSTLISLVAGKLLLGLDLVVSPLVLMVLPLIGLTLAGLGALIGVISRSSQEAGSVSLVMQMVLVVFGPVFVPDQSLSPLIRTVSLLSPATYAASALRQTLLGVPDRIPLWVDVLALIALTLALLWLAGQRLDWRGK